MVGVYCRGLDGLIIIRGLHVQSIWLPGNVLHAANHTPPVFIARWNVRRCTEEAVAVVAKGISATILPVEDDIIL